MSNIIDHTEMLKGLLSDHHEPEKAIKKKSIIIPIVYLEMGQVLTSATELHKDLFNYHKEMPGDEFHHPTDIFKANSDNVSSTDPKDFAEAHAEQSSILASSLPVTYALDIGSYDIEEAINWRWEAILKGLANQVVTIRWRNAPHAASVGSVQLVSTVVSQAVRAIFQVPYDSTELIGYGSTGKWAYDAEIVERLPQMLSFFMNASIEDGGICAECLCRLIMIAAVEEAALIIRNSRDRHMLIEWNDIGRMMIAGGVISSIIKVYGINSDKTAIHRMIDDKVAKEIKNKLDDADHPGRRNSMPPGDFDAHSIYAQSL